MDNKEIENKIKEILEKIKPFLNNDGGDVEFVQYNNGILYVRLLGSCIDCPMADTTIKEMIEYTITFEIPEVKEVINVI